MKWILGALLAAAPGLALAQDQWEQEVQEQLMNAALTVGEEGWILSHDVVLDSLRAGETHATEIDLEGGYEYIIIGVCDTDCSDMDLAIADRNGNELASDTAADDVPIISFVAPRNGVYVITTLMYSCSAQPCRYGMAAFSH